MRDGYTERVRYPNGRPSLWEMTRDWVGVAIVNLGLQIMTPAFVVAIMDAMHAAVEDAKGRGHDQRTEGL